MVVRFQHMFLPYIYSIDAGPASRFPGVPRPAQVLLFFVLLTGRPRSLVKISQTYIDSFFQTQTHTQKIQQNVENMWFSCFSGSFIVFHVFQVFRLFINSQLIAFFQTQTHTQKVWRKLQTSKSKKFGQKVVPN